MGENSKQVLERHHYISPSDTDEAVLVQLSGQMGCSADEMCDNKCAYPPVPSYHKVQTYVWWLHCKENLENNYYKQGGKGVFNQDMLDIWSISEKKFGL